MGGPTGQCQALDDAINLVGRQQQLGQARRAQARQQLGKELLFLAPDAQLAQHQGQGLAGIQSRAGALQVADVFGQRPVHQHLGHAFGLQAVEHAGGALQVAAEHRFGEFEHVVAGHIGHGLGDVLGR